MDLPVHHLKTYTYQRLWRYSMVINDPTYICDRCGWKQFSKDRPTGWADLSHSSPEGYGTNNLCAECWGEFECFMEGTTTLPVKSRDMA
jgi:DNA-directed RNA polymerase subunit RPC12/RpoP